MRKIVLDVEELEVESFATAEGGAETRGTVRGHDITGLLCIKTLDGPDCDSLSGEFACNCVDTRENQYSCGIPCETRDCP